MDQKNHYPVGITSKPKNENYVREQGNEDTFEVYRG